MYVTDPEAIQLALENMDGKNIMHPQGDLALGDGGFNKPWGWHLIPETVQMVEMSVELCDGTPSMLDENLTYWVNTVKYFCPWTAKVLSVSTVNPNMTTVSWPDFFVIVGLVAPGWSVAGFADILGYRLRRTNHRQVAPRQEKFIETISVRF